MLCAKAEYFTRGCSERPRHQLRQLVAEVRPGRARFRRCFEPWPRRTARHRGPGAPRRRYAEPAVTGAGGARSRARRNSCAARRQRRFRGRSPRRPRRRSLFRQCRARARQHSRHRGLHRARSAPQPGEPARDRRRSAPYPRSPTSPCSTPRSTRRCPRRRASTPSRTSCTSSTDSAATASTAPATPSSPARRHACSATAAGELAAGDRPPRQRCSACAVSAGAAWTRPWGSPRSRGW